jgi:hypothetical protein
VSIWRRPAGGTGKLMNSWARGTLYLSISKIEKASAATYLLRLFHKVISKQIIKDRLSRFGRKDKNKSYHSEIILIEFTVDWLGMDLICNLINVLVTYI